MAQAYGQCSLYLHPVQHDFTLIDYREFITALQKIGFIAQTVSKQTNHDYYTGENFLNHIAYMGCAPAIQLEADEHSNNFCHVKIHQSKKAQLISNTKQRVKPHCPHCKKPVINWRHMETGTTIKCDLCNTTSNIEAFNWRKLAGYAQLFIEVTDIFPREAIPQQILLDKLTGITDVDWVYFYSCR